MSDELESLGALGTASLVAGAIENHKDGHGHTSAHTTCANCSAALTGPFCSACGQSAHVHRSLLHLIEEILHGVWHFDTKSWRTLPLLMFFPGRLTRRYIDGQRKNYVSPLALFLFMVFLSFFMASLTGGVSLGDSVTSAEKLTDIAQYTKDLKTAQQTVARIAVELDAAKKSGKDVSELLEKLSDARSEQETAEQVLKAMTMTATPSPSTANNADKTGQPKPTMAEEIASKLRGKDWIHSNVPALNDVIKHSLDNPDLALYKLKNTTYKYSFLLVPISLPFLWLMFFWKRGVAMFDHAVFVLYSLSFMSLLFIILVLFGIIGWGTAILFLAIFAPPTHMFVQLRGTYGLGIFSALWRTVALLCVAIIVLVVFMVFVLMVSLH